MRDFVQPATKTANLEENKIMKKKKVSRDQQPFSYRCAQIQNRNIRCL